MNNSTQNTAEKGEKLFTAKQVERIVGERLARERRNGTALGKVRDLIMGLAEKGVLTSRNIPDMAAELERMLAPSEVGTAEDTEKANTDEVGDAPEESTGGTVGDAPEESTGGTVEDEIEEFASIFPNVDVRALLSDEEFLDYAEARSGRLAALYAGFLTEREERNRRDERDRSNALRRGLASTGFSSGKSGAEDYTSILTPSQIAIARNSGMSLKEYADYLSQVEASGKYKNIK